MKQWKRRSRWSLVIAACCATAPFARAQSTSSVGMNSSSINTWLTANGYATQMTESDLAAHRRKIVSQWAGKPQSDDQADQLLEPHLEHLRKTFPQFDAYPVYVQDSLLDSDFRGDLGSLANDPTVRSIVKNDWTQAANDYRGKQEFAEAEAYFDAKDAYDATPDKNSPAARELAGTMAQYQSRQGDRASLAHMQVNELAYLRYARELDVENTWNRAAVAGQAEFVASPSSGSASPVTLAKRVEIVDIVDQDNRQRFAGNPGIAAASGSSSFAFSVPNSTHGFTDITVPVASVLQFRLFDANVVDGDIETVRIVNGSGTRVERTITLSTAGNTFNVRLNRGPNELRVLARNEGTLGHNTGGLQVTSPVQSGRSNQVVDLNTGQTGTLRITAR